VISRLHVAAWLLWAILPWGGGCDSAPDDPRPSILLVVIDTLRADAVSALGGVEGTTRHLDALAREGLLYTRTQTPAPWTLPSHASLFSGLRPDRHRVGIDGRYVAPDALVMLAERLRDAGYQTAGFSENKFVSRDFNLAQGFETFESDHFVEHGAPIDPLRGAGRWLEGRDADRPFFLFLNLMDAHHPYAVRATNPFLPEGVELEQARRVDQSGSRICESIPSEEELRILRGLYLGDVAVADARVEAALRLARRASGAGRLLTVVTSDHGEHLGEHRLLGHQWSVRNVLLHVPLVVHGLPGVAPARIERPVDTLDLVPSILAWAGVGSPDGLDGRPLPTRPDPTPAGEKAGPRSLVAFYSGYWPVDWPDALRLPLREQSRRACGERDRVFGNMLALTRFPFKLIWFDRHPAELYDLRWDPNERSNLLGVQPEVAAPLEAAMRELVEEAAMLPPESVVAPDLQPRVLEALRAIGYLD
jgi:arylsulfatase A-like enzyme